jgi:transcriptional antiterminator NusG
MDEEIARPAIYSLRVTVGQEKGAADMLAARAKNLNLPVKAILAPPRIKGYVFVEAVGKSTAERIRSRIRHVKGVVPGEMSITEIEEFLVPKPAVTGMGVGDMVELITGPFRGERAKIMRIDGSKEEITVELFEAAVPIPVTVRGDSVKVIQKKGKED